MQHTQSDLLFTVDTHTQYTTPYTQLESTVDSTHMHKMDSTQGNKDEGVCREGNEDRV